MKPAWALALMLLAAWPMRDALLGGTAAGAGPDVIATMWADWWFSREWAGAAWGGVTRFANWPNGAVGTVLSPMTAAMWGILAWISNPAVATTWTDVLYLGGFAVAVSALAAECGARHAWVAGLAFLAQRYCVFALGETSIVGITAMPVAIGLAALLRHARGGGRTPLLAAMACMALMGLESPYAAPVLPIAAALLAVRRRSMVLAAAAAFGVVAVAGAGAVVGRGQEGLFGLMADLRTVGIGDARWLVVEAPWARAHWGDLALPGQVRWSLGAKMSEAATGRDYLGVSVVVLATIGAFARPRRGLGWWAFGLFGVLLATGSDWFGLPGPFALLNAGARSVVRGLSQPTRFLLLPAIGLSVAAAFGVERLGRFGRPAAALLGADALLFGGLSLRLPSIPVPVPACVTALRLEPRAGVLVWPWDGSRLAEATVNTRLWQIAHGQPGVTFGVGSWRLLGPFPTQLALERLGLPGAVAGEAGLQVDQLPRLGFGWVVSDAGAGEESAARARAIFGEPVATCEGAEVFRLAGAPAADPGAAVWASGAPVQWTDPGAPRTIEGPTIDGSDH